VNPRPPFPPFTEETARQKVQAAEDAWNTREADRRIHGPRPEGERGAPFPLR
jgi:nuclear transport factor 2 (NTF2) superfamily protein